MIKFVYDNKYLIPTAAFKIEVYFHFNSVIFILLFQEIRLQLSQLKEDVVKLRRLSLALDSTVTFRQNSQLQIDQLESHIHLIEPEINEKISKITQVKGH